MITSTVVSKIVISALGPEKLQEAFHYLPCTWIYGIAFYHASDVAMYVHCKSYHK